MFRALDAVGLIRTASRNQLVLRPVLEVRRAFNGTLTPRMPSKDTYTDPELRDQVKEEIHNSDKGGAPGQWSARKVRRIEGTSAMDPLTRLSRHK